MKKILFVAALLSSPAYGQQFPHQPITPSQVPLSPSEQNIIVDDYCFVGTTARRGDGMVICQHFAGGNPQSCQDHEAELLHDIQHPVPQDEFNKNFSALAICKGNGYRGYQLVFQDKSVARSIPYGALIEFRGKREDCVGCVSNVVLVK